MPGSLVPIYIKPPVVELPAGLVLTRPVDSQQIQGTALPSSGQIGKPPEVLELGDTNLFRSRQAGSNLQLTPQRREARAEGRCRSGWLAAQLTPDTSMV
jgi:hypothetical protein